MARHDGTVAPPQGDADRGRLASCWTDRTVDGRKLTRRAFRRWSRWHRRSLTDGRLRRERRRAARV